jgi:ketosteroid isomerase-like protein
MAGRAEQMRQRYEEFNRGDLESALQDWAHDFVWQGSNSTDLPGGGEHRGKDKAITALQDAVGTWDEFKLSADEFLEEGDTVVVLAHTEVRKGNTRPRFRWCTSGAGKATRSSASRSSRTPCRPRSCWAAPSSSVRRPAWRTS